MLTLINTNRMKPPIAPVGLDYVTAAVRQAGFRVDLLDLCLNERPGLLADYFRDRQPRLVGLSLRNVDDCFWPSGQSFLPALSETLTEIRQATDAPVVLGGVGFSIFAQQIVEQCGADFGIRGDGEPSLVELLEELHGRHRLDRVTGLIYREGGILHANPPAWPSRLVVHGSRDAVDNATYFRRGGQIGVETKRGCDRQCTYCADPLAKGPTFRLRDPAEVADEVESLWSQGVDVLHLCDAEFNLPRRHALAICDELIRRGLHRRVQWYAYLAVLPFDEGLARQMSRAGCRGINFTSDAAHPKMLATYGQIHRKEHLAAAVGLCRQEGIAVMLDMLLGGPGETPETLAETIGEFKRIDPDCAGASLGIRIYPDTAMDRLIATEGPMEENPSIRRHDTGPVNLLQPTFYIARALGERPAQLVRQLIDGDPRFFEPEDETPSAGDDLQGDHNYNENRALAEAITAGARGAYWDILRKIRLEQ